MRSVSTEEIQKLLEGKPYLQEKLFVNGFIISDQEFETTDRYPFYGNWRKEKAHNYFLYIQKNTKLTVLKLDEALFFLLGHAVDPFDQLSDELSILSKLASAYNKGIHAYYDAQNDLTGVFCTGMIQNNEIFVSNDCTGMQIVYYGTVNGHMYISSHSKLVGDLTGLTQSKYVERLVNSRFYHYMGTWLPGDLSPYAELRRLVPNHYLHRKADRSVEIIRFYPVAPIQEMKSEEEYHKCICWLSETMHRTLALYAQKWAHEKPAISVTGGRDSTTTLACANGLYDRFRYFSYISNEPESVDAYAAAGICRHLGLEHEVYSIPDKNEELHDTEVFAAILEYNAGCIGKSNPNDVRKRLFFIQNPKYTVEIKSWVNELGRGSQYVKYQKKEFPPKPSASYCRAMYKIILSPKLIHDTDEVFRDYLNRFYSNDAFQNAPWMELFWWEFCWSGGEGIFLTAEHRTSSEVAIPFNNRRYVDKMLSVPLEQRRTDAIPKDIIRRMNSAIADTGIVIKDLEHTNKRARLMRAYLNVFSKVRFK